MWSDNETDQDLLGFTIHAKLLSSIITDSNMLPVTVGLFGDWGGGKSSILKILQRELDQDENFAVIYFNSWVFEGYEDAKSAILTTLLNELRDHRNLKNIIGDETKALLKRVNWMKLLKFSASAGIAYLTANPISGHEMDHWLEAERIVHSRNTATTSFKAKKGSSEDSKKAKTSSAKKRA